MRTPLLILLMFVLSSLVTGCSDDNRLVKNLAKSDVDFIADAHLREMNRLMELLMVKLYKRNPRELGKAAATTIEQRKRQLFSAPGPLRFAELDNRQGTAALDLAFSADFLGDRVFAVMTGLVSMVHSSYNWQEEQFLLDSLDPQQLFDSARNIEILAWCLSNRRDSQGNLLLLTNSCTEDVENLSYERLYGRMIAVQDMLAFVIAGKLDRGINHVFQGAISSAAFLPMGL